VADNGLAKTPPMGWNSGTNLQGGWMTPAVREMADTMASNGMKEAGYQYINIDDTWRRAATHKGISPPIGSFPT